VELVAEHHDAFDGGAEGVLAEHGDQLVDHFAKYPP